MMIHLERYLDSHHKKVVKDKLDSLLQHFLGPCMPVSGISDRMGVTLIFPSLCGLGPFLRGGGLTFNFNNFRGFRLNKYFMGSMIKLWIF